MGWCGDGKKKKTENKTEKKSLALFLSAPLCSALLCSRSFPAPPWEKSAQGNFTTTTQAPARPMLRGTSYRKTERLTGSLSCWAVFEMEKTTVQRHADSKATAIKHKQHIRGRTESVHSTSRLEKSVYWSQEKAHVTCQKQKHSFHSLQKTDAWFALRHVWKGTETKRPPSLWHHSAPFDITKVDI